MQEVQLENCQALLAMMRAAHGVRIRHCRVRLAFASADNERLGEHSPAALLQEQAVWDRVGGFVVARGHDRRDEEMKAALPTLEVFYCDDHEAATWATTRGQEHVRRL